jgi:serine/threonine protein kinase
METLNPQTLVHLRKAECKNTLGSGGCSEVCLMQCVDTHDNAQTQCEKCFIVKRVLGYRDENAPDTLHDILINEYSMGKRLKHPNVIETVDFDFENSALILENFVGKDWLDILNDRSEKQTTLLRIFSQILDAVDYCHTVGVAHMDLKLENIIYNNKTDTVKVIDFGHAIKCYYDTLTVIYGKAGTEGYFPPEYLKPVPIRCYPDKVDSWCCGIILYNLLYDEMPWDKADENDTPFLQYIYENDNKINKIQIQKDLFVMHGLLEEDALNMSTILCGLLHPCMKQRMKVSTAKQLYSEIKISSYKL